MGAMKYKGRCRKICNVLNHTKISIIKQEIMKILVSKIHTFLMKIGKNEKWK